MLFWSIACLSQGLAISFAMLAASRFLLGLGEGGGFPAATRAVAEWFSVRDRATAMGIINGGTAVGAVVAPPLIAGILAISGWRSIFFTTGAIGVLWTVWWHRSYFVPPSFEDPNEPNAFRSQPPSWFSLIRIRETWGLVLPKFLSDGAWYFYLFWLPKYLYDARGFDIRSVGKLVWIPYAAAGLGCLVGGSFSSYLVQRRVGLGAARKWALGLSAAVMPFILLVTHVRVSWALAVFSLAFFGQQSWSTLVMVLPTDLFPRDVVGSVAGMVGFGGAIGGIAFGTLAGYLLDHGFGYGVVFALAGSFHVIGFLIILVAVPVVAPLSLGSKLQYEAAR
jgi:ACS family hexuronate transporter-like MFS transporter